MLWRLFNSFFVFSFLLHLWFFNGKAFPKKPKSVQTDINAFLRFPITFSISRINILIEVLFYNSDVVSIFDTCYAYAIHFTYSYS